MCTTSILNILFFALSWQTLKLNSYPPRGDGLIEEIVEQYWNSVADTK